MARSEEYKSMRKRVTPVKKKACKERLQALGARILADRGDSLRFMHNCRMIEVWPFTEGWRGEGIGSGKGLEELYKKLENES